MGVMNPLLLVALAAGFACVLGQDGAGGPPTILQPNVDHPDYLRRRIGANDYGGLNKYECEVIGVGSTLPTITWHRSSENNLTDLRPLHTGGSGTPRWHQTETTLQTSSDGSGRQSYVAFLEGFLGEMTEADDAVFRCKATQEDALGETFTAVSAPVTVNIAVLKRTCTPNCKEQIVSVDGDAVLTCLDPSKYSYSPDDLPKFLTIRWERRLVEGGKNIEDRPVVADNAIAGIDRLVFSPVREDNVQRPPSTVGDPPGIFNYLCRIVAIDNDITFKVATASDISIQTPLTVKSTASPVRLLHRSEERIVRRQKEIVRAACLFSANGAGVSFPVTWSFPDGGRPADLEYTEATYRSAIEFAADISMSFHCSVEGSSQYIFQLEVTRILTLKSPDSMADQYHGLRNDDPISAIFNCALEPTPDGPVQWYFNNVVAQPNDRWVFSDTNEELTINGLTKADLGGITCTANNFAGQLVKDARLLIYSDPSLQISHSVANDDPNGVEVEVAGVLPSSTDTSGTTERFNMTVSYTVDSLSGGRVETGWYKVLDGNAPALLTTTGSDAYPYVTQINIPAAGSSGAKTSSVLFDTRQAERIEIVQGQYFFELRYLDCSDCGDRLTYQSSKITVTLNDVVPTAPPRVEPFPYYILGIAVAGLLVIVIILLIICCVRRNKGEQYYVHDKEVKHGRDPEQELQDHHGFKDYTRPDQDPVKGSRMSLDMSDDHHMDRDMDSMNGLGGDIDVAKFNEDGSFVGQYGNQGHPSHQIQHQPY